MGSHLRIMGGGAVGPPEFSQWYRLSTMVAMIYCQVHVKSFNTRTNSSKS